MRTPDRYFVERGEGRPVVFVHGAGGSHINWLLVLKLLSDDYRKIALDLPGHYKNPLPLPDTIEDYGLFLVNFLTEYVGEPAVLVGHSMGGSVVYLASIFSPGMVDKVILVNSAIFSRKERFGRLTKERICERLFYSPKFIEDCKRRNVQIAGDLSIPEHDLDILKKFDPYRYVEKFDRPCHHIMGKNDKVIPFSSLIHTSSILGCSSHYIEEAGHMPMIEKPREFVDILERLLRENP